ncbi:3-deoxy-D-manno-octulosonic acid transferase [Candidatus Methylocalor cossyra]|uniref:3-deoxy-D-manno-octulosonic acid transferase n=1 Tax=Candidatus Methylocalor cossyra TaxID=3108543 RepID=A0ABP1CBK4_9GAMM
MRLAYSLLAYAALPLAFGRLAWRARKLPGYGQRWRERLAFYPFPPEPGVVWFHAVSVGEAEVAFPLVRELLGRHPAARILLTCTTPTGSARIQAVLGQAVRHVYLPYDLPDAVGRFLTHFRPVLGVILETELWPNLYRQCRAAGIPLAIVNGRLSEKSARGYRLASGLTRDTLAAVNVIAVQTALDAERYIGLGAAPEKVVVTGNIKFDIGFPDSLRQRAAALRAELFGTRPVWIAGSTHPGEEQAILTAFAAIRRDLPEALLILAPRHPERTPEVQALCTGAGFAVRRRSEARSGDADVFLLDTVGELRGFYGSADVAFVGGSLVARGGHNVLEPAAAGVPVLFGPHVFNFAEIARQLVASGGAIPVRDATELAHWTARLLAEPERRTELGAKGRRFVEENRGALARVSELIAGLLRSATAPPCGD